ncbi:MAG: hypothetical protein IJY52_02810 [Anaerotignum sp.]|nr:hypothetical protein [Anaerotignum sp.]
MKKRLFAMFLAAFAAVGMTACGGKEVETQEVDYDMTFENQTGIDVSKLEIRYAEDADWSEIALTDNEWKSSYQMPVSMEGQMPVAKDGWQVQMTFADGDSQKVWEGVEFADDVVLTFALDEDMEPIVTRGASATEANIDEADALTDDLADETEE